MITNTYEEGTAVNDFDLDKLYTIVVSESSKVYLVKDVDEINKENVFKPFKDFCSYVAEILKEYEPNLKYPKSLASTLLETAHDQQYFVYHLPNLTDCKDKADNLYVLHFLENLIFSMIGQKG